MTLLLRFNLAILGIVLIVLLATESVAIHDAYSRLHDEIGHAAVSVQRQVRDELASLRSQVASIPAGLDESRIATALRLEHFHHLRHLNIFFISADGRLVSSNHPNRELYAAMPGWLAATLHWVLDDVFIVHPVEVTGHKYGEIVIETDAMTELNDIWSAANVTLLPVLLTLLLASLAIIWLGSMLLRPVNAVIEAMPAPGGGNQSGWLRWILFDDVRQQITDAAQRLEQHPRQVQELSRQVLIAQESERKRLAAELHDELGQHLTALRFDVMAIADATDLAQVRDAAAVIERTSRQMNDTVRMTLKHLRPQTLERVGLEASLGELVDDWLVRHPRQTVELTQTGDCAALTSLAKLTVYRVVQEALTNISRHAGSQATVQISLTVAAGLLRLQIADTGVGCDLSTLEPGYGLQGIRERVEAVSGRVQIDARPGAGMIIFAELPITEQTDYECNKNLACR